MTRAVVLGAALILIAGCGGERTFDAEEFVDELNGHGAALELGEPLPNAQEGVEVFAIEMIAGEDEAANEDGHEHGGGSLVVAEDSESAAAQHRRCDGAVSILCYRAANAVLMLDGAAAAEHSADVERAIRALASE